MGTNLPSRLQTKKIIALSSEHRITPCPLLTPGQQAGLSQNKANHVYVESLLMHTHFSLFHILC